MRPANRAAAAASDEQRSLLQRVRRHPALKPLISGAKAVIHRRWWAVRSAFVVIPPMPDRVRSLLFVCKGNICRSPFAALLAARIAAEESIDVECRSAGLVPSTDGRCPDDAAAASERFGVRLAGHQPEPLTAALVSSSDLIVVMEPAQLREVARRWPDASRKTVLLAPYAPGADAYSRYNITDPFGGGPAAFDACYERLALSVGSLLRELRCRT